LLTIETAVIPEKASIGNRQAGEVMKESIDSSDDGSQKSFRNFRIDNELFQKNDIHIHVPEGLPERRA